MWVSSSSIKAAAALLFTAAVPVAAQSDLASVLAAQKNLTRFNALFKEYANVYSNLPSSGVTIVAPNDNAFIREGQAWNGKDTAKVNPLLKYHILNGKVSMGPIEKGQSIFAGTTLSEPAVANVTGGQRIIMTKQPGGEVVFTSGVAHRSTVVQADIAFDGGLIQVIDSIMVTPARLETTARQAYTDITSFVGALYATNLVAEFAEAPDVTIFAPRNTAFQQLAGTLATTDPEALKKILRYHIVPKTVIQSQDLKGNASLTTPQGALTITRFNNDIFVNSAKVIQTDILVANGVVHMLDNVLNPDKSDAAPDVQLGTQTPAFPLAGQTSTGTAVPTPFASNLPCTANCETPTSPGSGPPKTTAPPATTTKPPNAAAQVQGAWGGMALGVALGVWGMDVF